MSHYFRRKLLTQKPKNVPYSTENTKFYLSIKPYLITFKCKTAFIGLIKYLNVYQIEVLYGQLLVNAMLRYICTMIVCDKYLKMCQYLLFWLAENHCCFPSTFTGLLTLTICNNIIDVKTRVGTIICTL